MISYKIFISSFVLIFIFIFLFPFSISQDSEFFIQKKGNDFLVINNFSSTPLDDWILLNAAYWDSESENIVLTEPGSDLVGVIWLKNNVSSPFTVEFRYIIGGGSGADGMVFMFYKDWDYKPGIGGFLGFHCRDVGEECPRDNAPGYGIEFDNYYNSKQEYGDIYGDGDPSPSHIALIKDFIGNHITYVNDSRTNDNIWHNVKLIVKEKEIFLYIDGQQTLVWNGSLNRSNNHIGFGSGIWGYDHKHIIDNFQLYGNTITLDGIYSGWKIELISDNSIVSESEVLENENKVVLDVSGLDFPLKGYFKIYNQSELIFVSPIIHEIWGGDSWSIMSTTSISTSNKTNTVTTTSTPLVSNTVTASTDTSIVTAHISENKQDFLNEFIIIGIVSVLLLFSYLIIYRRKKS